MKEEKTFNESIVFTVNYIKELKKYLFQIIFITLVLGLIGYFYSKNQKDYYKATLSFIVEMDKENTNLSAISGITNQLGIDIGSSYSRSFSQNNVVELLKSRKIIESTLSYDSLVINNRETTLLHHYLYLNSIVEVDANFSTNYDSLINIVWADIIDSKLEISLQEDQANILNLDFTSYNQKFAKVFVERMIFEVSEMYSKYQTEKNRISLDNLQFRSDSILNELRISERNLAKSKDRNLRVVSYSGKLDEIRYTRDVQVLNTIYIELIKNIELIKMNIINETPLIQILDNPVLPIDNLKISNILWIIIFSSLGFFSSVFFLLFKKIIKDALETD